jgi:hypothetical protein
VGAFTADRCLVVGAAVWWRCLPATGRGPGAWSDFLTLIRTRATRSRPNATTPGAVAYQVGFSAEAAGLVQFASTLAVVVVFAAIRLATDEVVLVAIVASQLVSPIVGPLRDAAATAGRLPARRRPLGRRHPAGTAWLLVG